VLDEKAVFVTSANLTEAALDRNIEVGLSVPRLCPGAERLEPLSVLIEQGLLRLLPMA
jgi:hypothetical protein